MKHKIKYKKEKRCNEPVNLVLSNTTEQKMEAIVSVAKAIENLSKALISTNVNVTISNNVIMNSERNGIDISSIPESG